MTTGTSSHAETRRCFCVGDLVILRGDQDDPNPKLFRIVRIEPHSLHGECLYCQTVDKTDPSFPKLHRFARDQVKRVESEAGNDDESD